MSTVTHPHLSRSLLLNNLVRLTKSIFQQGFILSSSTSNPISFSAQLCAASRAIEIQRSLSQRLFTDTYAEALAGPEAMARVYRRISKLQQEGKPHRPRIQIRTRYFDDFALRQLEMSGSQRVQLVSLAAGLETRAFRLQLTKSVFVFEVDVKEVLERKEHILDCMKPLPVVQAGSRRTVIADLSKKGWVKELKSAGFDPRVRTIWLVEGLLYYLSEERVRELLSEIWERSPKGSAVCFSAVIKLVAKKTERKTGNSIENLASLFQSAMPHPKELMNSIGWQVLAIDHLGGENANYGRWDESLPHENTIYVSATKP